MEHENPDQNLTKELIELGFPQRTHQIISDETRRMIGEACLGVNRTELGNTQSFWLIYSTVDGETLLEEKVADVLADGTVAVAADYEELAVDRLIELAE